MAKSQMAVLSTYAMVALQRHQLLTYNPQAGTVWTAGNTKYPDPASNIPQVILPKKRLNY